MQQQEGMCFRLAMVAHSIKPINFYHLKQMSATTLIQSNLIDFH